MDSGVLSRPTEPCVRGVYSPLNDIQWVRSVPPVIYRQHICLVRRHRNDLKKRLEIETLGLNINIDRVFVGFVLLLFSRLLS